MEKEKLLKGNHDIDQQFMEYMENLEYSIMVDDEEDDDDSEVVLRALRHLEMESRVIRQRWAEPGKPR